MHFLLLQLNGRTVTAEVIWVASQQRASRKARERIMSDKELRRMYMSGLMVHYHPPGAESQEFCVSAGRDLSACRLGDQVQVLYNPAKSTSAVLSGENLWLVPLLLMFAGLFTTIPALSSLG